MDTATRLLELLTLLHARPTWTAADLAERLAVTERTVRRDVTRLRELGHPVEATRGRHGGYQLAPGDTLPPLVLDDREALAVVLGLRMAAAGTAAGIEESAVDALAKLERVLPHRLREQVQDLQEATVMLSRSPVASTPPEHLIVLAHACRQGVRVRFPYTARDAARSYRHVEPHRLVFASGRWYLVAFDVDRDDWRTFRVDRASSPLATGVKNAPREEPDAGEMVREALRWVATEVQAVVRLHVGYEEAERFWSASWGALDEEGESTSLLRVGAEAPEELARWLGLLPCAFEVLEPAEVRDALHRHARRLLEA
jgi:predicted DNA-binding transcriptional regulator YafY